MITIDEVRWFIQDFTNLPLYENLDANMALKYRQLATAVDLLNNMSYNQITKIEEPYYIGKEDIEYVEKDYADLLEDNSYTAQHRPITFIVLDGRSPLFMTKVNVDMHLGRVNDDETEIIFTNMYDDGLWFFSLFGEKDEQGKLGSYDGAIRRFIEDTIVDRNGILKKYKNTENEKQSTVS